MDTVQIILPCGFEIDYGCLKNCDQVIRCMMCDEENLVIHEILNRPRNRLRLKEKYLELKTQTLHEMRNKLSNIKQDPRFYVEKSFERVFNELDLRREEFKKKIEKKIDDHYTRLRKKLEEKKSTALEKVNKEFKTQEVQIGDLSMEKSLVKNSQDLKDKINLIESDLKRITQKSQEISKLIDFAEIGEKQRMIFGNDNLDIETVFGEIVQDEKLEYNKQDVFDNQLDRILNGEKNNDRRFLGFKPIENQKPFFGRVPITSPKKSLFSAY